jgi:hypothetical protein
MGDSHAMPVLRQLLTAILREPLDAARRAEVGAVAEEFVAAECRHTLEELGHPALSAQVRRVSLIDDRLGFDVASPTVGGDPRLLEVKGSTNATPGLFPFFLSRNEYDVGRRSPRSWSLVACSVDAANDDAVAVVGYCRASALEVYLPSDGNGRWTEAAVTLPVYVLTPGLPTAVP